MAVLAGCSTDGPPRKPVYGTITSPATTAIDGAISFLPTSGTKGPVASTAVISGKFRFQDDDGPVPGRHQVLIVPTTVKRIPKSEQSDSSSTDSKLTPTEFRLEVDVPSKSPFELNLRVGQ